jgi:hypothetical protein
VSLPRTADIDVIFAGGANSLPLTSATWTRAGTAGNTTATVDGFIHRIEVGEEPDASGTVLARGRLVVRATEFTGALGQPAVGDTWGSWECVAVELGPLNDTSDGVHVAVLARRLARGAAVA